MVYVLVIGREHSSLKRPSLTAQQIYYKFVMIVRLYKIYDQCVALCHTSIKIEDDVGQRRHVLLLLWSCQHHVQPPQMSKPATHLA